MTEEEKGDSAENENYIEQDGCSVPAKPPWHPVVSRISTIPFAVQFALAVYILYRGNIPLLAVWIAVFFVLLIPLRYLVCARCPYYGQYCSTTFGKMTPFFFKKQEGGSMAPGLYLDVVLMTALFVIPILPAWRTGGLILPMFVHQVLALRAGCEGYEPRAQNFNLNFENLSCK